jgi:C-terminal processing protease CtpA/Prc
MTLKVGDVIISINGKRLDDIKLQDMTQLFQKKPGNKIKLAMKRNEVKLIYRFVLKTLL